MQATTCARPPKCSPPISAYTRHALNARYGLQHDHQSIEVKLVAGVIYGRAPLFERFVSGQ